MKFNVSNAQPSDLDLLVAHRLNMWRDVHPDLGDEVGRSAGLTRRWIKRKLSTGELVGFIVRASDGRVAGSCCIWVREELPRPTHPRNQFPYIMSMYTEHGFRRKGVARLVLKRALRWCEDGEYERVVLHASDLGRPLYEGFGFEPTSEMRLKLRNPKEPAQRSKMKP